MSISLSEDVKVVEYTFTKYAVMTETKGELEKGAVVQLVGRYMQVKGKLTDYYLARSLRGNGGLYTLSSESFSESYKVLSLPKSQLEKCYYYAEGKLPYDKISFLSPSGYSIEIDEKLNDILPIFLELSMGRNPEDKLRKPYGCTVDFDLVSLRSGDGELYSHLVLHS